MHVPDKGRDRRDKWTRFVADHEPFTQFRRKCSKDHEHAPWGRVWGGKRTWATKLECEYIQALFNEMAEIITTQIKTLPIPTPKLKAPRKIPSRSQALTDTRASAGKQTKAPHHTNVPEPQTVTAPSMGISGRMELVAAVGVVVTRRVLNVGEWPGVP